MIKSRILGLFADSSRFTAPFAVVAVMLAACSGGGGGSGGNDGGSGGNGSSTGGTDGGGAGLPECPSFQSVCARVWSDEAYAAQQSLTVTGTVAEILSPGGASPCVQETVRIIEAGTGMEWNVNFESDGAFPAIAVGDQLEIASLLDVGDSEGNPGSEQLRVSRAGELIAYDADAQPNAISLPSGITLKDGEAFCYRTGDFCDFQRYALDVTSGGVTVTMRAGDTATVGSYRVVLRSNSAAIDTGGCDGAGFSRSLVVWPAL